MGGGVVMEPGPLSVIQIDGPPIEKVEFSERITCSVEIDGLVEEVPSEGSFGKLLALVGLWECQMKVLRAKFWFLCRDWSLGRRIKALILEKRNF